MNQLRAQVREDQLGKGAASRFYAGYFKKILKAIKDHVKTTMGKKKDPLFLDSTILLVFLQSGKCPPTFFKFDDNIMTIKHKNMLTLNLDVAGQEKRPYNIPVHRITDPETFDEVYFLGEFPASLNTLAAIAVDPAYDFNTEEDLKKEISAFRDKLIQEILPAQDADIQNVFKVVLYDDTVSDTDPEWQSLGSVLFDILTRKLAAAAAARKNPLFYQNTPRFQVQVREDQLGYSATSEYFAGYLKLIIPGLKTRAEKYVSDCETERVKGRYTRLCPPICLNVRPPPDLFTSQFLVIILQSGKAPPTFHSFDKNITTDSNAYIKHEIDIGGKTRSFQTLIHCVTDPRTGAQYRFMGEFPAAFATLAEIEADPTFDFDVDDLKDQTLAFQEKLIEKILPAQDELIRNGVKIIVFDDTVTDPPTAQASLAEVICDYITSKTLLKEKMN
ncbi:hypothetical protein CAPTEDRAFT_202338 [Capitella teleta]|uniref:STING ligand-binding domain-containing protein n=1 Tax=Capitella teleta TaxID=283909 RepID=R7T7C2_CAPTE|nr:hypothetical protein CAPTEDRAFT_202338 [Capitella teleta]|eukprot:ELT89544.1 hypothetical protein CAPTEDRAFT_202338 [Capitella teleta]